jgi:ABC-type uncharacterized transport system auxiliary subunit
MAVALLAFGALLSGCGGFVRETPTPAVYRLAAPRLAPDVAVPVELKVERPVAAAGLGDDRIATLWPDGRIDYYRDARWGDALPAVVGTALVEALARAGGFKAVHGDESPFAASHVLHVEIRHFEADYGGGSPPVVRVSLAGGVGRSQDHVALATILGEGEARAASDTQAAVIAAFNTAFAQAADALAQSTTRVLR